jgi:hypothetical protein
MLLHNIHWWQDSEGLGVIHAPQESSFDEVQNIQADVVQNESNMWIKILRIDGGGKYLSKDFKEFFQQHGIHWQHIQARTLQQNEVAKWMNRSLLEKMLDAWCWIPTCQNSYGQKDWTQHISTTTHPPGQTWVYTRVELFRKETKPLPSTHFWVHIVREDKNKLEPKSCEGVLVGYDEVTKGYCCFIPQTRKMLVSRDVRVDEQSFMNQQYSSWTVQKYEPLIFDPCEITTSQPRSEPYM